MLSLSNPQPGTAGASPPAGDPPPELELGGVVVVVDQAGLIVAAEPVCAALFQWAPAELVGQPLEVLLRSGADKIRQQLVPDQGPSDSEGVPRPRLFALARRKDDTSFAVAVTLHRQARCWWAVAFHDVKPPPAAQLEIPAAGLPDPASTSRHRRARVGGPVALEIEGIPDVFQRAPAEPASQTDSSAGTAPVKPEPPGLVAAPHSLESIPDIFQRTPAKPTSQPDSSAGTAQVKAKPVASATRKELSPKAPAPAAPAAQPAPASSDARLHELEQRLSHSAAALRRTRARLQQQEGLLQAAKTATQEATAALEAETARRTQLEEELAQARQAGDELNSRLSAELQTGAESEARLHELEQRLTQSAEELQRAQAQAQPPPAPAPAPSEGEPDLQDQLLEIERRLRTTVASLARTTAELETERGERSRSQQRAAALATQMQQLREELEDHLASKQTDQQRLAELEHQLQEQGRQHDLNVAKLQSALQIEERERKRLEVELLRSRAQSTDSARAGRALVNRLRRQLQPPAESLHHDVCRLLQLQLPADQKQLLQTMLENILLLQTSLQESPES